MKMSIILQIVLILLLVDGVLSALNNNSTDLVKSTDVTTTTPTTLLSVGNEYENGNVSEENSNKGGNHGPPESNVSDSGPSEGNFFNIKNYSLKEICKIHNQPDHLCNCNEVPLICKLIEERDASNATKTEYPCFPLHDKIKGSLMLIGSLFAIFGNSLVCLVTYLNWRNYNYCHKLIGGLALSDLIFAIFQVIDSIPLLWTCQWVYSRNFCKSIPAIYNICAWASIGYILIIAIERYYGIVRLFQKGLKGWIIVTLVIIVHIVGVALSIPMILHLDVKNSKRCSEHWEEKEKTDSLIYSWVLMIIGFLFPVISIGVLYGAIILKIWKNKKMTKDVLNERQQAKRSKDNMRVVVMLISIWAAFTILVFPIRIIWIAFDHGVFDSLDNKTIDGWRVFGLVPYSLHIAINPLIYSVADRKFRDTVEKLLGLRLSVLKKVSLNRTTSSDTTKISKKKLSTVSNKYHRTVKENISSM